jgi:ATP-dependent RNA helicase DDX24/MAK5
VLGNQKYYNEFIIASQTGSGKTLAFGLPLLQDILKQKEKYPVSREENYLRALILAPTRELAMQIEKHMTRMNVEFKKTVRVVSVVGGMAR